MYWCVDVLMCWCVDVLMCWCVDVLMCWCDEVMMCWRVDVLMCWCIDVLMRWSVEALCWTFDVLMPLCWCIDALIAALMCWLMCCGWYVDDIVLMCEYVEVTTQWHTSCPSLTPNSSATRAATLIAATLRGCVHPIFWPFLVYPCSCKYCGIWVVFPDPVSPTRIRI